MVMAYECQGIGVGAKCGKVATIPLPVSGIGDDGQVVEKIVWLCEQHMDELTDFEQVIIDKRNRGE